jgi:hypothetical protein
VPHANKGTRQLSAWGRGQGRCSRQAGVPRMATWREEGQGREAVHSRHLEGHHSIAFGMAFRDLRAYVSALHGVRTDVGSVCFASCSEPAPRQLPLPASTCKRSLAKSSSVERFHHWNSYAFSVHLLQARCHCLSVVSMSCTTSDHFCEGHTRREVLRGLRACVALCFGGGGARLHRFKMQGRPARKLEGNGGWVGVGVACLQVGCLICTVCGRGFRCLGPEAPSTNGANEAPSLWAAPATPRQPPDLFQHGARVRAVQGGGWVEAAPLVD